MPTFAEFTSADDKDQPDTPIVIDVDKVVFVKLTDSRKASFIRFHHGDYHFVRELPHEVKRRLEAAKRQRKEREQF